MNKSMLLASLAAAFMATGAQAAPNVYGNVHLSLNQANNDVPNADNNLVISSNTSTVGVKGSEEIGSGTKMIYKVEFLVNIARPYTTDPDSANGGGPQTTDTDKPFASRELFAGIKGGIGVFKVGTIDTNYKQTGEQVDALFRTPLEGRGFLKIQSNELHDGDGLNRGRQKNTLQYISPEWSGVKLVANTTFSGSNKESNGIGLRWENRNWLVYADYISTQLDDPANPGSTRQCVPADNCITESASKAGFRYSSKAVAVSVQYESAKKRTGGDYLFGNLKFNINRNNQIILTAGAFRADDDTVEGDSEGYALAYNHDMSKLSNIYFGYGLKNADKAYNTGLRNAGDESMITMGLRKRF